LDALDYRLADWVEAQWGREVRDARRLTGGKVTGPWRQHGVDITDEQAMRRLEEYLESRLG
jgi:hypothetical protein